MKIRIIVNPRAGAGAAARSAGAVSAALRAAGAAHDMKETLTPGDATRLAREAREDSVDVVAVVGGDGTLNEVAQAYLGESGPVAGPRIAPIPAGTGGDFCRLFQLDRDPERAASRITKGTPKALDLGVLDVVSEHGQPVRKAFLNIGSFGVSGRIDRIVNRGPKWLGGRIAYAVGTVRAMSVYRNAPVAIKVDGKNWYEGRIMVVAIANGRYFGGGMKVAPAADPSDGLFDVVSIGDLAFAEALVLSPSLYAGKHVEHRRVLSTRAIRVEATPLSKSPVYVDADGETPGQLPLTATIFGKALELLV
jgi:YegS/Rv2252/BmrU family lipid kinase